MNDTSHTGSPSNAEEHSPPRFVSFRLGKQMFALPLECVERVVRMVSLTPVPEAPPWVRGALDLHGRVIPAVDLRNRFDQELRPPRLDDRLVIARAGDQTIAVMVDEVTQVVEAGPDQVGEPPGPLRRSKPLTAVLKQDNGIALVLDPERLIPNEGAEAAT